MDFGCLNMQNTGWTAIAAETEKNYIDLLQHYSTHTAIDISSEFPPILLEFTALQAHHGDLMAAVPAMFRTRAYIYTSTPRGWIYKI